MKLSTSDTSNLHVRLVFRILFDSSHFLLQVGNLENRSKFSPRWQTVCSATEVERTELPAHLISGLNLPNGHNLIRRVVSEEREVVIRFPSVASAREYALDTLRLSPNDEATADEISLRIQRSWLSRFLPS
jgi:hypothetical protein